MSAPLPGMPARIGDPGVFLCSRADIEPWTVGTVGRGDLAYSGAPANRGSSPAPPPITGVWLVRALCPACTPRVYCAEHYPGNWWLTVGGRNMGRPPAVQTQ